MTSTLLNTPSKFEIPWGNTMDLEKEKRAHSDHIGGNIVQR